MYRDNLRNLWREPFSKWIVGFTLFVCLGISSFINGWSESSENQKFQIVAEFNLSPFDASAVKWGSNNQIAVTGLLNKTIQVFDVASNDRRLLIQRLHSLSPSFGLAWSPNGKYIASANGGVPLGSNQVSVDIWDAQTGTHLTSIFGPYPLESIKNDGANNVDAVAFGPNSHFLAVNYQGHTREGGPYLGIYEVPTGKQLLFFGKTGSGFSTSPIVYSPDGRYLANGQQVSKGGWRPGMGEIRIWDVGTGQLTKTIQSHTVEVTALSYSPNGKWIASGAEVGSRYGFLNKQTGKFESVSPNDPPVIIWDTATGQPIKIIEKDFGYMGAVRGLAFSPDGKWLATVSDDKNLRIWDVQTWELIKSIHFPNFPMSVDFSHDGHYIAVGAGERLTVWKIVN